MDGDWLVLVYQGRIEADFLVDILAIFWEKDNKPN